EMLGVTSIQGGSSALPTEPEACLFLWDCKQEKVTFRATPLPGTKSYGAVVQAHNGIVYGVAPGKYFAFVPMKRQTILTRELPVKTLHFPDLADAPVGERGLIYGLGDDAVFAIDPGDHSVRIVGRAEELRTAHGFCVTRGGELYFGTGGRLKQVKLR